jgi:phage gp36-like protein
MLRLTAPEGQPLDVIDLDRLNLALADASSVIDSYLRRRYLTPVSPAPSELVRACCIIARFDLAHGDGREPTEQMKAANTETLKWLEKLRNGDTLLADATPAGLEAFGQVQDAGTPVYRDGSAPGYGCGGNYPTFWAPGP